MAYVYKESYHKHDTTKNGIELMQETFNKMESRMFYVRPNANVGSFGIKSNDGINHVINWRVSGTRKDPRHGYVGEEVPHCRHTKGLLESMFKGWK